jgi:hypothetical protein
MNGRTLHKSVAVAFALALILGGCNRTLGGGLTKPAQLSQDRSDCIASGATPNHAEDPSQFDCHRSGQGTGSVAEVSEYDTNESTFEAPADNPFSDGEPTIARMQVGETAYTTPWGMWVDLSKQGWLHPEYPATATPRGTIRMKVERHENGYHVWPPEGETYNPSSGPCYVSPADTEYIKVAVLHLASDQTSPGTIPQEMESPTIGKMAVGATAYTTPWGMWLDESGRYWLNPEYTAQDQPGGTVRMKVQRTASGYQAWLPPDEHYKARSKPDYACQEHVKHIPVQVRRN